MMGGSLGVSVMLKRVWVFSPFIIFLRENIKFYSLIIFHFWLWFGGKYFEGRLVNCCCLRGL